MSCEICLSGTILEGGFAPDDIALTDVRLPARIEGMIAVATV